MSRSHVSAAQKGMPGYGELMHAIEEEIAHLLETGEALDIDRLGGLDAILSARTELCRSTFSPLIAHAIMNCLCYELGDEMTQLNEILQCTY